MSSPGATYRVQLRRDFDFRDAARLAPYLRELGITHLYCSPVLQAVPGSAHGYDVTDHSRLSTDLGGDAGWAELVAATRANGLGLVVDVVPNHMATDPRNAAWMTLLATGRDGPAAAWFDIDWDAGQGRVLLPVLGEPLLDAPVERDGDWVRYYDHSYPVSTHYRLCWWRLGTEELNYRRFFDVTSLIAVRVEDPDVFTATHRRLLRLFRDGEVDGLRIDHPDGLADPAGYLRQLGAAATAAGGAGPSHGTGGTAWIVVEKILEPDEALPRDWACAGTVGYDALRRVGGILLDPDGQAGLDALYADLTGQPTCFADVVDAAKDDVVAWVLPAEVTRLARVAARTADERCRDLSERGLREGLCALLTCFDVYRAYVRPGEPVPRESAVRLDEAMSRAVPRLPHREAEIRFLRELAVDHEEFSVRFQQTCGPVMAKGVEDTAFYRWFRLSSLNEVGGSPGHFGVSVAEFHRDNALTQRDWPVSMTTLSTHDTKRSEDMRARLAVLSECPAAWADAVRRWRSRHSFLDPNLEYLCWQTLVGAWPLDELRMMHYLEKASREAKTHTSWTDPDPVYENARDDFVRAIFADRLLLADVGEWVGSQLAEPARCNVLGQKLLQLAMPGVPDVYQGTEFETLALVDPDNRRPVDFARRAAALRALDGPPATAPTARGLDEEKLLVVSRCLRVRRRLPAAFRGPYQPLRASGPGAEHLVGFTRGAEPGPLVAALATRLPVGLARGGGWGATTVALAAGRWRDELSGMTYQARSEVTEVFTRLPVALLVRE